MAIQSLFENLPAGKCCIQCREPKPLTDFYIGRRKGATCHYSSRCKPCHNKYVIEYRKLHPEKHRASLKKVLQRLKSRKPDLSIKLKTCGGCNLTLPISSFSKTYTSENGYRSKCKKCLTRKKCEWAKTPTGKKKYHEQYKRKRERLTIEGYRWRRIRQKYGMSQADYEAILSSQNGRCGICFTDRPPGGVLAIDHCHTSGRVRGLLCKPCNSAIGLLKEKTENFEAASAYIRKHLHHV